MRYFSSLNWSVLKNVKYEYQNEPFTCLLTEQSKSCVLCIVFFLGSSLLEHFKRAAQEK